jgi:hypothetical protein
MDTCTVEMKDTCTVEPDYVLTQGWRHKITLLGPVDIIVCCTCYVSFNLCRPTFGLNEKESKEKKDDNCLKSM